VARLSEARKVNVSMKSRGQQLVLLIRDSEKIFVHQLKIKIKHVES
jgi:hypothetical protein